MAIVQLPYQCLKKVGNLIVAARGSSIDLLNAADGAIVSSWHCPRISSNKMESGHRQEKLQEIERDGDLPPAKKRKASASDDEELAAVLKTRKRKKSNRSDAITSGLDAPVVVLVEVTHRTHHVIAVTGEDKSIRVFEVVSNSGIERLNQVSERMMPKRPCALAITVDDSTIISADKFGDVYSLPLLYTDVAASTPASTQLREPSKLFVPAASELTIHSQRNRKALENQKKQTVQRPERSEPDFEHKLLLGHVSMLTDIKLAIFDGREYIISADRDEHIRISRGLPQTHIIESFCLGHNDFVSRIALLKNRPDILISGGGDDELFVWNWLSGKIISKTYLMKYIVDSWSDLLMEQNEAIDSALNETDSIHEKLLECPEKLAVSSIYHVHSFENALDIILVTCEAIPAIFTFILTSQCELEYIETVKLSGNILAIVTDLSMVEKGTRGVVISVDNIHKRGCRELEATDRYRVPTLHKFAFSGTHLISQGDLSPVAGLQDLNGSLVASDIGRLTNLFYTLENLRKKGEDVQEERVEEK